MPRMSDRVEEEDKTKESTRKIRRSPIQNETKHRKSKRTCRIVLHIHIIGRLEDNLGWDQKEKRSG